MAIYLGSETPDGSKKQILVIDDDEDICTLVELILCKEGYLCASAKDGLDGLNREKLEHFDLILLDLNMPKLSGQQFVEQLAKGRDKPPIVIITAQANPTLVFNNLLKKYKNLDLLTKPFLPTELVSKVEKYLQT